MVTRVVVGDLSVTLDPKYAALAELDPAGAFSSAQQTTVNRALDDKLAEIAEILETGVVPDSD